MGGNSYSFAVACNSVCYYIHKGGCYQRDGYRFYSNCYFLLYRLQNSQRLSRYCEKLRNLVKPKSVGVNRNSPQGCRITQGYRININVKKISPD